MVTQVPVLRTLKKTGLTLVRGHLSLHSEFQARLSYRGRLCLNKNEGNKTPPKSTCVSMKIILI